MVASRIAPNNRVKCDARISRALRGRYKSKVSLEVIGAIIPR